MARGIWVYAVAATIRREWFGRAAPARIPVSQGGEVGC